jgi:hypothetical protein
MTLEERIKLTIGDLVIQLQATQMQLEELKAKVVAETEIKEPTDSA